MASSITITGNGGGIIIHRILNSQSLDQTTTIACSRCTTNVAEGDRVMVIYQDEIGLVTIYGRDAIEAGTTISALQTSIDALIAACGSGGDADPTVLYYQITVTEAQNLATDAVVGVHYDIIAPEGQTGAHFYTQGISTPSGNALNRIGTFYKDISTNGSGDYNNYANSEYDIDSDVITWYKFSGKKIELFGSATANLLVLQQNWSNDNNITIGLNTVLNFTDPTTVSLTEFNSGSNNTINCTDITGTALSLRIDDNVGSLTFPTSNGQTNGIWSGIITKKSSTVECQSIDVSTSDSQIMLHTLGLDSFIGIVNIKNTSGGDAIIDEGIETSYAREYKFVMDGTSTKKIYISNADQKFKIRDDILGGDNASFPLNTYPDFFSGRMDIINNYFVVEEAASY